MSKPNIIATAIELVAIDKVMKYPANPRKGDIDAIRESIRENGFFAPLAVQKSTSYILIGNHRYEAAIAEGYKDVPVIYLDVDDDRAKKIVLSDNRTNDLSTYQADILTELLGTMPDVTGTGYKPEEVQKMLAAQMDNDQRLMQSVVQPKQVEFAGSDDDWDLTAAVNKAKDRRDAKFGEGDARPVDNALNTYLEKAPSKYDNEEDLRTAYKVADIQKQLERLQDMAFIGTNYWGIPELRYDMLEDQMPASLKTWGGKDATPDDGVSTYIYNFGLASSSGLPWDRAWMATFTYDTKFDSLLNEPAFQIAKMMHNGLKTAIVPDTSMWLDDPRVNHLIAAQNAQWMGRFMQEAGIKVIPRLMWCDLESIKYARLGIPQNAPIVAVCIQAIDKKEAAAEMTADGLRLFVKELEPQSLIVYGGGTAKQVIKDAVLPASLPVTFVDNYATVRRHVVFDNAQGKTAVEKHQRELQKEAKNRMTGLIDEEAAELSEDSD